MRVLYDTQAWLWTHVDPDRLSPAALDLIQDPAIELFLSAASAWEITIKHALGRLPLPDPPLLYVPSRMARSDTRALVVTHEHALRVSALPPHHRDPFDRILVAQCQSEGLRLLTADPQLRAYDIDLIWAA